MKALMLAALLMCTGCAYSQPAVVIPTGNPVTDILVTTLVWEGASLVAKDVAHGLLTADSAPVGMERVRGQRLYQSRRDPSLVFVGDWR
ncbi:MAG: hypothetical protein HDQ88_10790 [Clostridia bacterium]|nr:hypothetical protein [Clostridia bacterium]